MSPACNTCAIGILLILKQQPSPGCLVIMSHIVLYPGYAVAMQMRRLLQVQRRIRLCGQRLLTDRRIKCAQAPVRASAMDQTLLGATANSPIHLTTLAAVAQHAQQGHFHSLQAFAGAVRRAVAGTCLAVEDRVARQIRQGRPASTG